MSATTTTTAPIITLRYRSVIAGPPETEQLVPSRTGEKHDLSTTSSDHRANVAVAREAPVKSKNDPYGYHSRKKTVCASLVL